MYIISVHNGINLMLPADDCLDWKNLFSHNITNAMVHISWKADSYLACQEIPCFCIKFKKFITFYIRPIVSHLSRFEFFSANNHCNIMILPIFVFKWFLSLRFSRISFVFFCCCSVCMWIILHPWFNCYDNIRWNNSKTDNTGVLLLWHIIGMYPINWLK